MGIPTGKSYLSEKIFNLLATEALVAPLMVHRFFLANMIALWASANASMGYVEREMASFPVRSSFAELLHLLSFGRDLLGI